MSVPYLNSISRALVLMLACVAALTAPGAAADRPVHSMQGSVTFFDRIVDPNLQRIEDQSGAKLTVIPNKSIWGLIALLEGRTDMAMISGGLTGEIEAAKELQPALPFDQLKPFEIARSRVAFVVHPSNPLKTLSLATVKKILLGEMRNWKDVGGPDLPIRVVATQNGGGTVIAVRTQVLAGAEIAAPDAVRLESARHVLKVIEQETGAFGIAQLGLSLKSAVTIVETDTPVEQVLSLVTLGDPRPSVKSVIDATRDAAIQNPL
jgi:phosphate transport system substrate-binding protein